MQVMVIEFARNVMGYRGANSTEFDAATGYPVIDLLPEQKVVADKGGTMRLGNWECRFEGDTRAAKAYGSEVIRERHRHRYELNNQYRKAMEARGLVCSGVSPDGRLVEVCELKEHPWMVSCQFHPEFRSRPNRPHPLFRDFIGAAKEIMLEGAQPPLPLSA
jgi:CTP synthase